MKLQDIITTIQDKWNEYGLDVKYEPISHGAQLKVGYKGGNFCVRLYNNRITGVKLDWSQVKNDEVVEDLQDMIDGNYDINKLGKNLYVSDNDSVTVIGCDETGKGDLFGGLITCAVYLPSDKTDYVNEAGVADSKELDDTQIYDILHKLGMQPDDFTMFKMLSLDGTAFVFKELNNGIKCELGIMSPAVYNKVYSSAGSINEVLAELHASTITNFIKMLKSSDCTTDNTVILIDQFAHQDVMKKHMLRYESINSLDNVDYIVGNGYNIPFEQKPKAESNPSVALASMIARAQFLVQMQELGTTIKEELPLGSGSGVKKFYKKKFKEKDVNESDYVKINFSIVK